MNGSPACASASNRLHRGVLLVRTGKAREGCAGWLAATLIRKGTDAVHLAAGTSLTRAIFFDLDGTLTDPKPGITGCIQYALERLGRPVPTRDELEWCIGPPLLENFEKLVGSKEAQVGVDLYRERFSDVGIFENAIYSGIEETLRQANARGAELYVASSKPHVFVTRILAHFDLSRHFRAIFGSELDGTRTDKTELLRFALARTGVDARTSTMIGDRSHDAIGAAKNAMAFVGVLYGYGSVEEFREVGVNRWVERPSDLLGSLFADED